MKKLFSTLVITAVAAAVLIAFGGCNVKRENPEQPFDYASLYKSERTEAYPYPETGTTSRASFGYTLKKEQGYNDWYYLYGASGDFKRMTLVEGKWSGDGAIIDGEYMRPSSALAVRGYIAPAGGEACVYGNFKSADASAQASSLTVYVNDRRVYGLELGAGDTAGKYFEIAVTLQKGDRVYFAAAGGDVSFNPVVTYENAQNKSLYHLTAKGKQYGDVFPWYDDENGKLYMGFLWSDNAALADNYNDALELSSNMLTFTDVPEANNYDVWQRYKENYRKHFLFDTNNFIDRNKYPFGVRDNMLYFDKEKNRYLLIAGCYYAFDSANRTSDLVIYASDDPYALSWTKPGRVVEAGYSHNLPECPSLMKIGDRWYVFVSVAYNTAHQVGPSQYWTGDAGVDCMDVNWEGKEFAFLDGEDLCAARVTQVKDKVYMWGWIPSTYDTMPWAPWGGYLNLPREVVQRSDGSLGARLDPALASLLDYGNIYTLADGNFDVQSGAAAFGGNTLAMNGEDNRVFLGSGYGRNFITFKADMKNSSEISYVMRQSGRDYKVSIVKENGRTYMKVLSPDDQRHTVNSVIEIDGKGDVFDVQIVADGGFIEFFVNGNYALTARTAMTEEPYQAYLYSSGEAAFDNVKINKLLPYGEIG